MVTWLHRKRYSLTVKEDGHGKCGPLRSYSDYMQIGEIQEE